MEERNGIVILQRHPSQRGEKRAYAAIYITETLMRKEGASGWLSQYSPLVHYLHRQESRALRSGAVSLLIP